VPRPLLKIDANEGRLPDEALLERLRTIEPEMLRRYPTTQALEARLASRFALDASQVIVTAGADDALDRICRATLEPGRQAVVTDPTFVMIPRYVRLAGAELVSVGWLDRPFPIAELVEAVHPSVGAAFVASPNNPTGLVARSRDLTRLAETAPTMLLAVDLAYVEFADENPMRELLELPNVVITRTFSKAWGLAGLRIGYALGAPAVITWLRAVGHPYPTSAVSLALAGAALDAHSAITDAYIERVRRERSELFDLFRELGIEAGASQGNFVLARFSDAWAMADALLSKGIAVRRFERPGGLADRLRITCPGNDDDFQRLRETLVGIAARGGITR
jgi:histidinol-phosphate aminotransferase